VAVGRRPSRLLVAFGRFFLPMEQTCDILQRVESRSHDEGFGEGRESHGVIHSC
jgi:hypothetical protein